MSAHLEAPARSEPQKWPLIAAFCIIWSGLVATEQVSGHLLPDTVRLLTTSAVVLSWIQFLNPFFGVIAQPIVGILSDRIWTPIGRRAFFLITGAPIVAICLWFVPEARTIWFLFILVLVYQFFQDVLWGSDHPLMADLFPPKQRVIVSGLLMASAQVTSWLFLHMGMKYLDAQTLYRVVAIAQVVLVSGFAFFLNERPNKPKKRPKLTVKRYITDLLGHPMRAKFAALNFFIAMFFNIAVGSGFLRAFATTSLNAPQAEYGPNWAYSTLPPLFLSIPAAIVIEKWMPKQWALVLGFVVACISCYLGWIADSPDDLMWIALTWGFGTMLVNVTFKPFFTEYVPSDIIGQVSGSLNICYAAGRSLATLSIGYIIQYVYDDDYRYIFPIALGCGIIATLIAISIPDLRYKAKREGKLQHEEE